MGPADGVSGEGAKRDGEKSEGWYDCWVEVDAAADGNGAESSNCEAYACLDDEGEKALDMVLVGGKVSSIVVRGEDPAFRSEGATGKRREGKGGR